MEMAKKFGGAKQKCMQRIRSRTICNPSNFQLDISQVKSSNGQIQGGGRSWRGGSEWRFGRYKERKGGGEASTRCGWGWTAKDEQVGPSTSSTELKHHLPQQPSITIKIGRWWKSWKVWMPAGDHLPHHSNPSHPFRLDPALLVRHTALQILY